MNKQEKIYVPFKMVIKDYKFDGTFFVEYVPVDTSLTSYTYGVTLPFNEEPSPNEEQIISRLAGGSPQDFWAYELESKKVDLSSRNLLIGREVADAHLLMPENILGIKEV